MTTKLPPEQSKLDRIILDELFMTVPEEWNAFFMVVEPRKTDGEGVTIAVVNPDMPEAEIEPSEKIRESVDKLVAFLAKEKRPWEQITYKAFMSPDGAWHVNITVPLPPGEAPKPA
jgi:hypothetical protein